MAPLVAVVASLARFGDAAPITSVALRKNRRVLSEDGARRLEDATATGAALRGDLQDDYTVEVRIDGSIFHLNVDTGSGIVGVAGNATIGCDAFYDASECDGVDVAVTYGSGHWAGVVCEGTVAIGDLAIDGYKFAAYEEQRAMTTCSRTPEDDPTNPKQMVRPDAYMEGILCASFAQRQSAGSKPLIEALFDAFEDVDRKFGLQCCGYDAGSGGGGGSLDVGGFDESRFSGDLAWVPVVQAKWWAVRMTSFRVGAKEALPEDVAAVDVYDDGIPQTIVDSGTSGILVEPRAFKTATDAVRRATREAEALPDAFWAGAYCAPVSALKRVDLLPTLTIGLAAGAGDKDGDVLHLKIPPCRYVVRVPAGYCMLQEPRGDGEDSYAYVLGAMPAGANAILGQSLFEEYYVAHDMGDEPAVGFAKIEGCGASCAAEVMPGDPAWAFAASAICVAAVLGAGLGAVGLRSRRRRSRRAGYDAVAEARPKGVAAAAGLA